MRNAYDAVLAALTGSKHLTLWQIIERCPGYAETTIKVTLHQLKRRGAVVHVQRGGRGRAALYARHTEVPNV